MTTRTRQSLEDTGLEGVVLLLGAAVNQTRRTTWPSTAMVPSSPGPAAREGRVVMEGVVVVMCEQGPKDRVKVARARDVVIKPSNGGEGAREPQRR